MLTVGAGCASDSGEDIMAELDNVTQLKEGGFGGETVTRFVDREAGVVMYQTAINGYGGGLTAVPISETDLE